MLSSCNSAVYFISSIGYATMFGFCFVGTGDMGFCLFLFYSSLLCSSCTRLLVTVCVWLRCPLSASFCAAHCWLCLPFPVLMYAPLWWRVQGVWKCLCFTFLLFYLVYNFLGYAVFCFYFLSNLVWFVLTIILLVYCAQSLFRYDFSVIESCGWHMPQTGETF